MTAKPASTPMPLACGMWCELSRFTLLEGFDRSRDEPVLS